MTTKYKAFVIGTFDDKDRQHPKGYWSSTSIFAQWQQITQVAVTVSLRPGYSRRDHMFDINEHRVAEALDDCAIYWSVADLRRAIRGAIDPTYGYAAVEIAVDWLAGAPPTYTWNDRKRRDRMNDILPAGWYDRCWQLVEQHDRPRRRQAR